MIDMSDEGFDESVIFESSASKVKSYEEFSIPMIEQKFNVQSVVNDFILMEKYKLKKDVSKQLLYNRLAPPILIYIPSINIQDKLDKIVYLGPSFDNSHQMHIQFDAQQTSKYKFLQEYSNIKSEQFQNQKRPFIGMNPDIKESLIFHSLFESGNLDLVEKITEREYILHMRVDVNSKGHSNWYYFAVKNKNKNGNIKFRIRTFTKQFLLYSKGLKPYIMSINNLQKIYEQQGENVTYRKIKGQNGYELSFEYKFNDKDDEVYFSTLPPYSYRDLMNKIKEFRLIHNQKFVQTELGHSLSGLSIPLLTITDLKNSPIPLAERKVIVILGRIHPSESNSSWMIQGILDNLISDNDFAINQLKKVCIFKIIPMINPDGVVIGNYRNSLSGFDLNRQFNNSDFSLLPEVKALKNFLQQENNIFAFFDLHGHSVRRNVFTYSASNDFQAKVMPIILSKISQFFRLRTCSYGIPNYKQATARSYASQFAQLFSYTMEASFLGYGQNERFNSVTWMEMGKKLLEGIFIYFQTIDFKDQTVKKGPFKSRRSKQLNKVLDKLIEENNKATQTIRSIIPRCKFNLNENLEPLNDSDQEQQGEDSDFEENEDLEEVKLKKLQQEIKISIEKFNQNKVEVDAPKRNSLNLFQIEDQQEGTVKNVKKQKVKKCNKNTQINEFNRSNQMNSQHNNNNQTKIRQLLRPHIVCDHYQAIQNSSKLQLDSAFNSQNQSFFSSSQRRKEIVKYKQIHPNSFDSQNHLENEEQILSSKYKQPLFQQIQQQIKKKRQMQLINHIQLISTPEPLSGIKQYKFPQLQFNNAQIKNKSAPRQNIKLLYNTNHRLNRVKESVLEGIDLTKVKLDQLSNEIKQTF